MPWLAIWFWCFVPLTIYDIGRLRRVSAAPFLKHEYKKSYQKLLVIQLSLFGEDFDNLSEKVLKFSWLHLVSNLDLINNNSLLNIISSGYKIQFSHAPYQSKPIVSVPFKLNSQIIEGKILDHLGSKVIYICFSVEGQNIYWVFTVKK